jgi:maltooligosyltrehalose trehalohydrolase
MGISREIGAHYVQEKGTTFTVWAPEAEQVDVILQGDTKQTIPLQREAFGYWLGLSEEAEPGTRYTFKLNNDKEFPDPASKSQPDGVHKASEVIDPNYNWTDQSWKNLPLEENTLFTNCM